MIVSALLTAVGINLGLTVLLISAFSLLRRRPPYVSVYSPRHPYAPLESWIAAAWRRTEDDIHAASGLDGVVFVRIFVFRSRARPEIPHFPFLFSPLFVLVPLIRSGC
jgi:hypothetical protein